MIVAAVIVAAGHRRATRGCHARAVALGAGAWGGAMTAAGLMSHVWPILLCLAVAGGGGMVSGMARHTIWDQAVPDELRGRLAGIEVLSSVCGPQFGQVRAGATAGWTGVRASVWGGGAACVAAVAVLAAALPKLMAYDADTDPDALRRKAQKEAAMTAAAGAVVAPRAAPAHRSAHRPPDAGPGWNGPVRAGAQVRLSASNRASLKRKARLHSSTIRSRSAGPTPMPSSMAR